MLLHCLSIHLTQLIRYLYRDGLDIKPKVWSTFRCFACLFCIWGPISPVGSILELHTSFSSKGSALFFTHFSLKARGRSDQGQTVFRRSLVNEASSVTKICKVWNFNLSEANQAVLYITFALFVVCNISWPFKGFGCVLLSRILRTRAEKCVFCANYLFIKDLLLFFDPL